MLAPEAAEGKSSNFLFTLFEIEPGFFYYENILNSYLIWLDLFQHMPVGEIT